MARIEETFRQLKETGQTAFIPFITAGDPDEESTFGLVKEFAQRGADIVELGIPFSDPLADGPTIQAASQRALEAGLTPPRVLSLVERLRKEVSLPIVTLTYYNPVHHYGVERFVADACRVGLDGAIIPDLPPEEAQEYLEVSRSKGFDTIFLAAPTSTDRRLALIAAQSAGFIYCVSLTGVTGERDALSSSVANLIARLRRHTDKPLGVGFGVSTPEQAREVSALADGVIVGSAIVKRIEQNLGQERSAMVKTVGDFVEQLVVATKSGGAAGAD